MLANFSMYDFPEVHAATNAWWRGVAAALRRAGLDDVPESLTWDTDTDVLRSPELLLTQTCGYPLTHELAGIVSLVATPAYGAEGCRGVDYCSFIVVSEDNGAAGLEDLRGAVCTYNGCNSQSGYNTLRAAIAPLAGGDAFFSRVVKSGGHQRSIEMVASGNADMCAVDCVTYGMLARHRPAALSGTRVLATTQSAPGLPYVTRAGVDEDYLRRLRDGLSEAFADPQLTDVRDILMLAGMQVLDYDAYGCIDDMENAARVAGYAHIH
jgi:ABC-type phosphate/phosphonate transport system substrate-binding protein